MSKQLLKSTASVGSMTLISRRLGFAGDMLIARFFGVDIATDAFFAAFKLPNFLRRLFAEGSLALILTAITALGAFFNAALLFIKLRRGRIYQPATGWRLFAENTARHRRDVGRVV
ncbi:lipid II flippase MurJ [Methylomicrobium sp. Wu6]|uniref:lipid II flippase MurJ n=1 Tax=Methylomicrobium sp. Wu6 TaxID=3107928 RepID=UPI002DD64203|nr:lipid II flippase MurJ [Methylomicrobium sp. Wu6]MEC4747332.1 lipid II flippase MurJ [Methylomicrobium sp. Wu6]